MEVLSTNLKDVLLIKPHIHEDFRGQYIELYKDKDYREAIKEKTGQEINFVEDNLSTSSKGILRGIHGDDKTWKLISCLRGNIYVVVVDCDKESSNYGKWQSFDLSEKNRHQILVPPKYGLGHLVMSEEAFFHYKESEYYNPKTLKQFTYRFDDPLFKIWWPIKNPILSRRDDAISQID